MAHPVDPVKKKKGKKKKKRETGKSAFFFFLGLLFNFPRTNSQWHCINLSDSRLNTDSPEVLRAMCPHPMLLTCSEIDLSRLLSAYPVYILVFV